jgi:hypothetical protein
MNKHYGYEHMEMWEEERWQVKISPILELVCRIADNEAAYKSHRNPTIDDAAWKGYNNPASYHSKTGSMNVPNVIKYWNEQGLAYEDRELGHLRWVIMTPKDAIGQSKKLKALVIIHRADYSNSYWAMEMLEYYREYNLMAVKENMVLIYIAVEEGTKPKMYTNILMEACSIRPVDETNIYLDVSPLMDAGQSLSSAGGAALKNGKGREAQNPDESMEKIGSLKASALNISKIWQDNKTNNFFQTIECGNAVYDRVRLIYSETGHKLAEGMYIEYTYDNVDDPALKKWLDSIGVKCACHDKNGERWVMLAPCGALETPEKKLPVVCVFQEVNYSSDHLVVSAIGQFLEYIKLAAEGETFVLFFARESPDDNDLLCDIIQDAGKLYPVDLSRVYVTGHSHNGHFARDFAYRRADIVAAAAPLGNFPGLPTPSESGEVVLIPDDKLEAMTKVDMPLITITGYAECGCMFQLNQASKNLLPGQEFMCPHSFEARAKTWQRRLKASSCPMKSLDEIAATLDSNDYVTRKLGFPCDKTEIHFIDGFECYAGDIKNNDGKYHLRIVGVENMPHMPLPMMPGLSWAFMRRFARDLSTGKVNELY